MSIKLLCIIFVICVCVLSLVPQSTRAQGPLFISCEGIESGGGGAHAYQYTLVNNGPAAVTLTLFYVGTGDLTAANYTNWVAPAGFTPAAVVANWPTLMTLYGASVMATTGSKTPHGAIPPQATFASAGGVAWTGSVVLNPSQQVTFGFDNPHPSWDMEWFAEHPNPVNSSQAFLTLPIAGPSGVFTAGYVHGPSMEPVPTESSTFGRIKALYGLVR